MNKENTILLFFIMMSIPIYSLHQRPYSHEEKQFYIQNQIPTNHPWLKKSRDDSEVRVRSNARPVIAKRMAMETVFKKYDFKHIKLPQAFVSLLDDKDHKRTVQTEDEITPEFTSLYLQQELDHDKKVRLNAGQAEELSTLYHCIYLHENDITVNKEGVYVMATHNGSEHFITSWQKIWFGGLKFDDGAIAVFNKKQLELQGYVIKCLKQYKKDNPQKEIDSYTAVPLLPEDDEVQIEGRHRELRAPLGFVTKHLFADTAQRDAFWAQIKN